MKDWPVTDASSGGCPPELILHAPPGAGQSGWHTAGLQFAVSKGTVGDGVGNVGDGVGDGVGDRVGLDVGVIATS